MMWLLYILFGLIVVVLIVVSFVIIVRLVNRLRYPSLPENQTFAYYSDPSNLDLYPQDFGHTRVEHITGAYLNGFHLIPGQKMFKGVVVTFGGSDGTPSYEVAQYLANQGFEVLSLFYYGLPNQRPNLTQVPLDFYQEVEAYIKEKIDDNEPVTVYGLSKGAELTLNLVGLYDSIDHAVLVAPSFYNFSGLDYQDFQTVKSSWTYQGSPVSFVDATKLSFKLNIQLFYNLATKGPITFLNNYVYAVNNDENIADKQIPFANTSTPLLIFAGGEDQMWQSAEFANQIKKLRPKNTDLVIYEDAGHLLFGPPVLDAGVVRLNMGGEDLDTNMKANNDYMDYLLKQLIKWHQKSEN